jgi:hypothetical protein
VVRSSWDVQFFRLGTISGAGNTYTRLEIPESLKRLAKHLQESITRKTISPNQSLVPAATRRSQGAAEPWRHLETCRSCPLPRDTFLTKVRCTVTELSQFL